jgi:hypothetical protein
LADARSFALERAASRKDRGILMITNRWLVPAVLLITLASGCAKKSNPIDPPASITAISGTILLPDSLAAATVYVGYGWSGWVHWPTVQSLYLRPDLIYLSYEGGRRIVFVYKKLILGGAMREFTIDLPPRSDTTYTFVSWIDTNGNQYPDSIAERTRLPYKNGNGPGGRLATEFIQWHAGDYFLLIVSPRDSAAYTDDPSLSNFGNTGFMIDFN